MALGGYLLTEPTNAAPLANVHTARAAFLSATTEAQVRLAMRTIQTRALRELQDGEDNYRWMELFVHLTQGRPRQAPRTIRKLNLGTLEDMDGILAGVARIARTLAEGDMAEEELVAYSGLVKLALEAQRTIKGERVAAALEEAGALPFFLGADLDDEANANNARDAILGALRGE